jgi:hypothetical protein
MNVYSFVTWPEHFQQSFMLAEKKVLWKWENLYFFLKV